MIMATLLLYWPASLFFELFINLLSRWEWRLQITFQGIAVNLYGRYNFFGKLNQELIGQMFAWTSVKALFTNGFKPPYKLLRVKSYLNGPSQLSRNSRVHLAAFRKAIHRMNNQVDMLTCCRHQRRIIFSNTRIFPYRSDLRNKLGHLDYASLDSLLAKLQQSGFFSLTCSTDSSLGHNCADVYCQCRKDCLGPRGPNTGFQAQAIPTTYVPALTHSDSQFQQSWQLYQN